MTPYIHINLCDHDFTQQLHEAVIHVFSAHKDTISEAEFQRCVVAMTYALYIVRHRGEDDTHILDYLRKSIKVMYCETPPTYDQDESSVAVDCNLNYIWRY